MGYVHDDDDPFYDHEDAMRMQAAAAAATASASASATTTTTPSTAQYGAARASALRPSQFVRPTLSRTTSGGRPTATFDEFLSDSSDSDDDDDGSAIQRMQDQADDMEYIDTTFQLDSPNGNGNGDDDSFRMDVPPTSAVKAAAGSPVNASAVRVEAAVMDDDSDSGDDGDGDDDVDNLTTRPFAGHNDSFIDTRKREASSPDALDSSFRLIGPNATAGDGSQQRFSDGKLSPSDDGNLSGEFNGSLLALNSPPGGGYLDDSFVGDRPSDLDRDYSETLDDSFAGDRPSNLDQDYRMSLDDSIAGDRPSNLDADYDEALSDSFVSDRPSNLDADYNETLDDSFAGDRPSNLNVRRSGAEVGGSSGDVETANVPDTTPIAPVSSEVARAVPSTLGVNRDARMDDNLTESRSSLKREDSNESVDDNFVGGRRSGESGGFDDSFARGSLDNVYANVDNSMTGDDPSFRMSGPSGDYWENNDSFVSAAPGDAQSEAVEDSASSFAANSGFDEVSQQFEQGRDGAADRGYSIRDGSNAASRVSSGLAAAFSPASYDNQQTFFVGSMGSEAEALAYIPLASSPAFSEVAMLGDENETGKSHGFSSLERRSFPIRASGGENRIGAGNDYGSAPLAAGASTLVSGEEPPLLPITIKAGIAASTPSSAVKISSATQDTPSRSSSASRSSVDKPPFMLFTSSAREIPEAELNGDLDSQAFAFACDSASGEQLGDSFMRDSNSSEGDIPSAAAFIEDHSFRLSSPNASAGAEADLNSFMSDLSLGDSFADDSYSGTNFSEVAARHLEGRASEMSRGSESKHDGNAETQVSPPPPSNSQSLANDVRGSTERQTDEKLDFTGVYRDSVRSRDNARISLESGSTLAPLEDKIRDASQLFTAASVSLLRTRSDSVQRASERKVEDFFRRTYNYNKDDDDLNFASGTRQARARTTVEFNVHEEEEENDKAFMSDAARQRSKSTGTKKTIDLKSLRAGSSAFALQGPSVGASFATRSRAVSRASTRLQIKEDLLEVPGSTSERRSRLTFRSSGASSSSIDSEEGRALAEKIQEVQASRIRQNSAANEMVSSRVIQRNVTISISSDARSSDMKSTVDSSSEDSPNMIPMPPRYMLSPKAETPMKMSGTSVFSISQGFGKSKAGHENGNSMTPTLPKLSMGSSSLTPSPFSASYAAPSSGKIPPHAMSAGMAPGFKWNAQDQLQHLESRSDESGGMSIKESIWHEAGITRPTLSDHVATHFHRFSSSLRNTLQRTGVRFFGRGAANANQTTSPQSICSAPPKLSRKFDDKNFYLRFGRGGGVEDNDEVIAAKQALGRNQNSENMFKKRHAHTMVILLCALLGIGIGLGLIHIDSLNSSFNPTREEQLQQQSVNGGLKIATAAKWILLLGKLFLRLWNCVTMPLLFCHILNGIADMTMNRKAGLVLSFRSLGYMLSISVFTTLEGIGMMAVIKSLGLFKVPAAGLSIKTSAAALRRTLGVADRLNGTVALMCESDHTYLQAINDGKSFRCSNESIPLPVYQGAAENGTMRGNNPAIFVFNDVNNVLKAAADKQSEAQQRYYPQAMSFNQVNKEFVNSLVPVNVVDSLISSTPVNTVAIALLLGLVCGKRAWERAIRAKHEDFAGSRIEFPGGHVADKPHYILGVFVELQLALEWLVDVLETLAPIGVLSLFAGNIVLHRQELMMVVNPMMQLVLGVVAVCVVHVLVVMPIFMKVCFKVNVFMSWSAFLPAYLICFCTGSVVLSLPTVQQCYECGNVVTKSMAQVSMGMLSVLHRNAHALYYPVAILWLLQTNTQASDVELTTKLCMLIGMLTVASCFFAFHPVAGMLSGTNGGSNLLLIMTLWRAVLAYSDNPAALMTPPTFPLFVACDVLLSRFVAMVNLHDNVIVTRMIAEHCDEVVVEGASKPPANSVDIASSPMYI